MSKQKINFIVKNGRYAGSSIALDVKQEYSLGRSFLCDIAMDDSCFAERQMLLNVGEDGVHIKLLAEGKLAVNGEIKDSAAQSEWRNMDPRSVFRINTLEFSFEVPVALLNQFEQRAKARELATLFVDGEYALSNKASTHSLTHFIEIETQVPREGDDDYDDNKSKHETKVAPTLKDALEFDVKLSPKSMPKATSANKINSKTMNRSYLIWGTTAANLGVFIGVYYLLNTDFSSETHLANQLTDTIAADSTSLGMADSGEFSHQIPEGELSPFVLEGASLTPDDTMSSAITKSTTSGYVPVTLETSPVSNAHQQVNAHAQINDPFLAYEQQRSLQQQLVSKTNENPSRAEILETHSFDKALLQASDLLGPPSATGSDEDTALNTSTQTQSETTQIDPAAEDRSLNKVLAAVQGRADSKMIVIQGTREILSDLGLGHLNVWTRPPETINGTLEKEPVIVVDGYVSDRRIWMRAKDSMREDIIGIGHIVDKVSSSEVRKAILDKWIDESPLQGKVKTFLSDRGLVAQFNLSPLQKDIWTKLERQYIDRFENEPELLTLQDPGR